MSKSRIRKKAKKLALKALPFMLALDVYQENKSDPRIEDWMVRQTIEKEKSADAFIELSELIEKHPWLKDDVKYWR